MKQNKNKFKKTYSKIAVLLIIVLLFILVFKALSDGIKINSISLAGVKIDGLYLKLNKKLVLNIDNIDLTRRQSHADSTESKDSTQKDSKDSTDSTESTPKISDFAKIIRRAITAASFFEHLEIANIQYNSESSSIFFDGKKYKINIPYLLASFELNNDGDDILLDIETLKVKQDDLDIKGRILFVEKGKIFAFDLESYIDNNKDNIISYQGETDFKYLVAVLDSTKLTSIDVLAPYIKILDSDVYEWIYKKTKFSQVTVNRAYITLKNINSRHIEQDIIDNLYADGLVENVELKIEDEFSPILANQVGVIFDKGALNFYTKNASYEGVIADSGEVRVKNFLDDQPLVSVKINAKNAVFDERINNILRFYDINIPVEQKDGFVSGFVNLDILLPTMGFEAVVTPNGSFSIKDSNIAISGFDVFVKNAKIDLNGDIIEVKDSSARFRDILDTNINLKIDTKKENIALSALPSKFVFSAESLDIINLTNKQIDALMDFSGEDFVVNFTNYDTQIIAKKNNDINIKINDFKKLVNVAPILTFLDIYEGNLALIISESNESGKMDLRVNLHNLAYPIYNLNGTNISHLALEGTIGRRFLRFNDKQERLRAAINMESGNIDLKLNKVLVNLDEILESKIPLFADLQNDKNTKIIKPRQKIQKHRKTRKIVAF